jgi:hypothetical protein
VKIGMTEKDRREKKNKGCCGGWGGEKAVEAG